MTLLLFLALQDPDPVLSKERVVLRTTMGDIVLAFYPDRAPKHVAQILKLVKLGIYDTTFIYRVEPDFILQVTDAANRVVPLNREQKAAIKKIPREFDVKHKRGRLTMAHGDDPDGAETSFSILLADSPHLDGQYTVFGEVDRGMDVVDTIAEVETDMEHHPYERVTITSAIVVESAEALSKINLRAPIPQVKKPFVPAAQPWVLWTVGAMIAFALAAGIAALRGAIRVAQSLAFVTVLIGAFVIFAALVPQTNRFGMPAVGAALFIGIIAMIRVMGSFERGR